MKTSTSSYNKSISKIFASFLFLYTIFSTVVFAQSPSVSTVSPAKNALNVATNTNITITFSTTMNTSTFTTNRIVVKGYSSGKHSGTITVNGTTGFTFDPTTDFNAGEIVTVDLTSGIQSSGGQGLTNGYHWSFNVAATPSALLLPRVDYGTEGNPNSIFVSDIDGDGDGDFIGVNSADATVAVLKNNGDGTFMPKVIYNPGGVYSVFMSDLDGDGDADMVISNALLSGAISVMKNNGNGTFASKVDYATGNAPENVFISDIDGDGDGDAVTTNHYSNSISVLKNNGDGTFGSRVDYAVGVNPWYNCMSDLDGDGDNDIVLTNYSSASMSVFKNNGDGSFGSRMDYATGDYPVSVKIGDLDGDGDGDVVVGGYGTYNVSVFKNNGDGTFASKVDYPDNLRPRSLFISDIDGDGDADLVVGNVNTSLSIFKNNGNGTFAPKIDNFSPYTQVADIFVSDIDGDGDADVLTANDGGRTFSVLKGALPTITATAGANGTISPIGNVAVSFGTNQTFTISPDSGYYCDSIIVDGVKIDSTTSYTFTNVIINHTIRATFTLKVPKISVSPTSVSFGGVLFGTTKDDSLIVNNPGQLPLFISDVASNNAEFTVTPTSAEIPPNETQKFYITFAPTNGGAKSGNISFTHNAAGSPKSVAVNGTGLAPLFSISETEIFHGFVLPNTTNVDSVTVMNTGTSTLNITSVTSNNAKFVVSPTNGSLNINESMNFYVSYKPLSFSNDTAKITFNHNAVISSNILSATGVGFASSFSFSKQSLNFGDLKPGTSKMDSVVLTNSGTAPLVISSVISSVPEFSISPTTDTISAQTTAKFYVTFSPTAIGTKNSNIRFNHNAVNTPSRIAAMGRGAAALFAISKTNIIFPKTTLNETTRDSFIITNSGNLKLMVTSISSNSDQFGVLNASDSVEPNSTKKFFVTFTPTTEGVKSGKIFISHNASETLSEVNLTGSVGFAWFSVTRAEGLTFGSVSSLNPKVDSITINNSGEVPLKILATGTGDSEITFSPLTAQDINPGQSKKLYVTFAPEATGFRYKSIYFTAVGRPDLTQQLNQQVLASGNGYASPGLAFIFDGIDDRIEINNSTTMQTDNDMTITFWLKLDDLPRNTGRVNIMNKESVYEIFYDYQDDNLVFLPRFGNGNDLGGGRGGYNGPIITKNKWYHIAFVVSQSLKNVKTYVNGEHVFTARFISWPSSSSKTIIAPRILSNFFYINGFPGKLDEFTMWNKALSENTLRAWMGKTITPQHQNYSNLVVYYDFDENVLPIPDKSGKNNNGSVFNFNANPSWITSTAGVGVPYFNFKEIIPFKDFGTLVVGETKLDSSIVIINTGGKSLHITSSLTDNQNYTVMPASFSVNPGEKKRVFIKYTPVVGSIGTEGFVQSVSGYFYHNSGGVASVDSFYATGKAVEITGSNNKNLQSMPYNYSAIDVRTLPSSDNYTVSFWAKDIRTVVIDYFLLSVAPMQFYGSDCLQNLPNKLIQSIYSYEWHHYTIQLSKVPNERNSLLTYIDGKNYSRILLGNSADSVSYINRIRISSYSNIDELAIWNTILSPNEIIKLSHYSNITVSPYKPNLMGYYRFEEPASLTIADSSGNGRNAITGQLPTLTLFSGAPTGEPLILKGNDVLRDHNFGKISFGDSSRLNVTMYNPGNQLLRLSSVQTTDSSFSVVGDVSKIAPNASQTIFLKFKPKVYGDFIDTLTFNHNGPNSPLSIIVTGRSTGTTTLTVPTVLNFGSMPFGTSLTQIFTIRNNGTAPAIITGIAEDYVGSPIFVCSPLSLVVQPGATDSIAVAFKPKFVEYTSTYHKIVVRTEDAGTYTIPVSGKGTYAGQLQVPTTVLMYEDAKALSANTKSVVINNPGTGTVVITGYTCSDSDVVVQGPASIPPGDSGRITVSVIPKLPGVKSGTVYITYDKANSNGGAIPMIDSSITFSATATFGPLTDADNAFYSGYTTYSGGNYYGYNMDKGFLQDSNRIRFDSAFTFETWIQPYGGGFPIFYDKGGIKITLHPAIYTLNYSGYYYGYFSSSASTYFNSFYLGVEMNSQSIEFGKRSADYTYVTYDYYGRTSNYIYSGYQGDIPKDKWLHLAVTWKEGDLLRAYLNGNLIGSASVIGSSVAYPDSNNDGFFISPYYGYMDETMLWKKAKTQEEILRSYNEGIGSTIGLAAYWKFSETSGQTFFDVSGNKNHLKNSNPSDDKSLSVLPLDSGGLMLGNISLPAYNINSTNPRTVNLPLKTLGRNRGVRVELPDTTYVKLTSQYFGVSKSEYEYSLLLYPQSVGTSNVTINFYDLLTNELLKTYEVALRGFSSKISGSIVNKTNNAECLNKPITVQLTNNNNEVLRETTTTCGYEFNNLAPGVYKVKQLGIASFYYTLGGKCYFNSGISPGIPVLRRDGFTYSVNAITIPGETNYPNNFSSIILETTFNTGLAFPATLCSGFKNHSLAGLGNGKTADTVSWTNPVEWNGELPSDTADIAVAYPGYYDQLTVKLDLTELGAYCASHSCTGDVTTLRSVYLADSATMTVVGNGAWNITNNLLVEGSMLLDLDSNATLLLGNLEVKGNLTIPEGKNPTIIINGNMTISGTFNPGNSTIILNGEKLNTITSPLAVGDSTKNTVDFYNLTLNSDSTLIADNIRIHNQLFLNGNVRSGDSLNDVGSENDNIIIVSPSPDAIVGNGKVLNGTIVRSIDQSEPGTYRFHTPTTQITLTSSQNLPTFISLSRVLNTMPVDTFYNVLKGGTVNETDNTVTANDVSLDGKWKFASSNYQQNDPTGGPVYEIISDGGATADISLTYDVAQLNGLDVSSLALIQEVSALKIFSKNDNDGDIVSDTDRTELEWSFSLYRDSVSEQSFVETYTGSNLTVENLSNGKYIIVPKDSVGWRIISKMVNNISSYDSIPVSEVTVFISPGQLNTVAFTRNRVFLIIASSTLNGTITPQDTIEVAMNRSVTYSIVPNFGYRINSVVIDGFDIGATNSFTFDDVSEPHTISATFVFDDNVLFRTFAANSDLSKKATKLAYKKGSLVAPPNIATAVEGEFKKLGKPGAVFLGVPQTVKADAKKYAWIAYKKAGDLGKLFTSPHSEKYYPLDTLRGTKSKAITGLVKAERKKYNNKAFEQAVAFKLNLYASEDSITPNNFGALVLDTALTLAGKELHGVTLSDISLYLDTVMTYWKARGIDDDTAYAELKAVIDIIQLINEGFSAPISATNHTLASESVIKKNPYAVILKGVKRASDVGFVKFIAGKQVRRTPILAEEIPTSFALYQNYPNPFNPTTTIRFDLPKSSLVSLKIYNILGQEITTLLNKQEYDEGQYEIVFDASRLATGVYFYRLSLNDNSFTEVKKLVLLK